MPYCLMPYSSNTIQKVADEIWQTKSHRDQSNRYSMKVVQMLQLRCERLKTGLGQGSEILCWELNEEPEKKKERRPATGQNGSI